MSHKVAKRLFFTYNLNKKALSASITYLTQNKTVKFLQKFFRDWLSYLAHFFIFKGGHLRRCCLRYFCYDIGFCKIHGQSAILVMDLVWNYVTRVIV